MEKEREEEGGEGEESDISFFFKNSLPYMFVTMLFPSARTKLKRQYNFHPLRGL